MITRRATAADAPALALMNQQLIRDEGHHNRSTLEQLTERMQTWLAGDYTAVIFQENNTPVCYALYRQESDHIYLRQFFVTADFRRNGIGSSAIRWLLENDWKHAPRIRIDVLSQNHAGRDFWYAIGFKDYCITMDLNCPPPPENP